MLDSYFSRGYLRINEPNRSLTSERLSIIPPVHTSLQRQAFPGGHSSTYWPGLSFLNFRHFMIETARFISFCMWMSESGKKVCLCEFTWIYVSVCVNVCVWTSECCERERVYVWVCGNICMYACMRECVCSLDGERMWICVCDCVIRSG